MTVILRTYYLSVCGWHRLVAVCQQCRWVYRSRLTISKEPLPNSRCHFCGHEATN